MNRYVTFLLLILISGCASLQEQCAEKYGAETVGYSTCVQAELARQQMLLNSLNANRMRSTSCYGFGPTLRCVTY